MTWKVGIENAEVAHRIEEQEIYELAGKGSGVAAAPPKTLGMLLEEFVKQHAEENLAPTTIQGYRETAAYLDPHHRSRTTIQINSSIHRHNRITRPVNPNDTIASP